MIPFIAAADEVHTLPVAGWQSETGQYAFPAAVTCVLGCGAGAAVILPIRLQAFGAGAAADVADPPVISWVRSDWASVR